MSELCVSWERILKQRIEWRSTFGSQFLWCAGKFPLTLSSPLTKEVNNFKCLHVISHQNHD